MGFLAGLICGLVLSGVVYAQLNPTGPSVPGPSMPGSSGSWQQGGSVYPQPFMDIETGQIRQMMPLNPRNPC